MSWLVSLLAGAAAWAALQTIGLGLRRRRLRILWGLAQEPTIPEGVGEPLSRPFSERVLQPALGAVGGTLGHLVPRRLLEDTALRLRRAGLAAGRPADWLGASALAAGGLGGYALLLTHTWRGAPVLALIAAVVGWSLPGAHLRSRARSRARAVRDHLPDALDLLTVSVEAGLGFDQALGRVGERFGGVVGQELGRVLRDQRLGTPRREAMLDLVERIELPELAAFVHAVLQSEELGVRIGSMLRVQSDSLRTQRRQRAEEEAAKAPIKMAFPLIFLILPALLTVILGPALLLGLRTMHGHGA